MQLILLQFEETRLYGRGLSGQIVMEAQDGRTRLVGSSLGHCRLVSPREDGLSARNCQHVDLPLMESCCFVTARHTAFRRGLSSVLGCLEVGSVHSPYDVPRIFI